MNEIKCCAVCGCTINPNTSYKCIDCGEYRTTTKNERKINHIYNRQIPIFYTSHKPKEHYEELSQQLYKTKDKWYDIFVEQELSRNPLFSHEKYLLSCNLQKERDERLLYYKNHPEEFSAHTSLQPKCPTCNSTNISRISELTKLTHAFAFGLFSKTAKSQFQCNNCGYKW